MTYLALVSSRISSGAVPEKSSVRDGRIVFSRVEVELLGGEKPAA